ncbi:MAG: class I SAM-dependent methyltransferase, partial [Planctomycetes bacterium]|nr:class I SAM-dependent methyltransferase [Planctomycetota bacterium]
FCLDQDYFPYGDAFTYHALLRHLQPQRVIEVGAGWSSAVLLDTDERHLDNRIDCVFVEPYPDRLRSLLRPEDVARTRLLQQRVQDVDLDEFRALRARDILFIDSSHVCKTGSDVAHALFAILPCLQPGVWVHFHDIHTNFEYEPSWVREGRAWNEAYFLRAFLMHNRDWEIALHGATLAEHAPEELLPLMPKLGTAVGGSLWLRKR